MIAKIVSFLDVSVDTSPTLEYHVELDIHANMVVLGSNCFLFDGVHGRTWYVETFDTSIGTAKKVPIFDAAVAYTLP